MDSRIETIVTEYESGKINRRIFFERLIGVVGTYAVAHHFLETSGLAMSLLSPQESGAANVESTAVKYPAEGLTMEGYLSRPSGTGPFPAVIVIHENRGLNDHIRDVARRLASQGYAALAVDLLSRQGGAASFATPDGANRAFQNTKDDDVVRDLNSSYNYLNSNAAVRKDTIAVMGFCWGGQRSFLYATANPRLKAAVVFYGPPPEEKFAQIQAPVLGNYGEQDTRITSTVWIIQEKMNSLGKIYDAKVYPGAPHAFFNDTNTQRYNEAAANDAWERTLAFFKKHLG
jgi:carboxymethylenebutenolidase